MLVDGTYSHPRGGRPTETHLEDLGLFLNSRGQKQGLPGARLHCTSAPKCFTQNVFLLNELSYQDVQQQPFLLTVAYAWGLQDGAEKLNPPEDPDFCPLVRSVIVLRERVKDHVAFTKWDVIQDLGRVNPGATSQWPQIGPTSFGRMDPTLSPRPIPVSDCHVEQNTSFMEATTQTTSLPCLGLSWPDLLLHWIERKRRTGMYWSSPLR